MYILLLVSLERSILPVMMTYYFTLNLKACAYVHCVVCVLSLFACVLCCVCAYVHCVVCAYLRCVVFVCLRVCVSTRAWGMDVDLIEIRMINSELVIPIVNYKRRESELLVIHIMVFLYYHYMFKVAYNTAIGNMCSEWFQCKKVHKVYRDSLNLLHKLLNTVTLSVLAVA